MLPLARYASYALVGEERKRLPIKYNPNSAEGYEVVKQVVTKDSVSPETINRFGSLTDLL
jgi:hypothetical protein